MGYPVTVIAGWITFHHGSGGLVYGQLAEPWYAITDLGPPCVLARPRHTKRYPRMSDAASVLVLTHT